MTWAAKVRTGNPVLKGLLMTLANYANEDGELWHGQRRISFDAEIPERSLRRRLGELVEMGIIQITERRHPDGTRMSSLTRLLMDEDGDQPANLAGGSDRSSPAAKSTSGQIDQRPKSGGTSGQNGGAPAANKVAANESTKNRKEPSVNNSSDDWPEDFLEQFWKAYPPYRRSAKKTVHAKLLAIRRRRETTWSVLFEAVRRYAATDPGEYAKGPVVWLNGGCWDDQPIMRKSTPAASNGFAELLRERRNQQFDLGESYGHGTDGYEDGPIIDAEPVPDPAQRRF